MVEVLVQLDQYPPKHAHHLRSAPPASKPIREHDVLANLKASIPRGITFVFLLLRHFFCGWNFTFPTRAEQILWRSTSVTMFLTVFAYEFVTKVVFFIYPTLRRAAVSVFTPYLRGRRSTTTRRWMHDGRLSRKAKSIAECIRNNSISQDSTLTITLKAILPIYCVGFLYLFKILSQQMLDYCPIISSICSPSSSRKK